MSTMKTRVSVHDRLGHVSHNCEYYLDQEMDKEQQRDHDSKPEQKAQWCPSGIFTKSQKRRVQRLRCREIRADYYNHNDEDDHRPHIKEWRPKMKSQAQQPETSINMVFILPQEFMASEECTSSGDEGTTAQLVLDPQQAIFEKPEESKHRHLKALYMNGFVNGKPMSKMLVDGGAAVNIMPMTTFRKLGKTADELIKTNMILRDYGGGTSEAKGVLNVELTIGSKTLPVTFFVIDGKGAYSLLLGRDWIHANCCIPSTMHQSLIQWIGDQVEIVSADKAVSVASADPSPWQIDDMECLSGKTWEGNYVKVTNQGLEVVDEINSKLFL
uniref:Peptidase A2 domain-containing protein n=1 Tax=Arundo donax TaxID=35708 RepID=A0A0A9CRF3_ARUDO